MVKLECVFLMNISLYLKLTDIPIFCKVNHKTKEAINGLRINPINDDNQELTESLQIVNEYFPKLETLYLTKKSFEYICSTNSECKLPNVHLFKTNSFVTLSEIMEHQLIREGINKVLMNCEIPNEDYLLHAQSVCLYISVFSSMVDVLIKMKTLKRIYLFGNIKDITQLYYLKEVNRISKYYEIILEPRCVSDNYEISYQQLKKLSHLLQTPVTLKYEICFGIQEYCKSNQIPTTRDDFDKDSWVKRISKDYFPSQLTIRDNLKLDYLQQFDTIKKINVFISGHFILPSSVDTIVSGRYENVTIDNWNELNDIKSIIHYNYNINTPKHYRKFEKNLSNINSDEIFIMFFLLVRTVTNVITIFLFFSAIFNNGLFNYKDNFISVFPSTTISLGMYIIFICVVGFSNLWSYCETKITKTLSIGFSLLVAQYLFLLFYNQRYYGFGYSEIVFLFVCYVSIFLLDLFVVTIGLDYRSIKRMLETYLLLFYEPVSQIVKVFYDILAYGNNYKIIIFSYLLAISYCWILPLFNTYGLLFVGNLLNAITTLLVLIPSPLLFSRG